LKLENLCPLTADDVSPPTRGRGLKRSHSQRDMCRIEVAPHAGAWIETRPLAMACVATVSPPTRGRGLKHTVERPGDASAEVAPHAGAWIETRGSVAPPVGP